MNTLTLRVLLVLVPLISLAGCAATSVYKPGNKDEQVIAKTLSIGDYELQGVSEDERPAADEVAKKFLKRFTEDLSEKGIRVSEKNSDLVVTFSIRYRWKVGITAVIPLPTIRYELMVMATVKRVDETVLVVSGYQSGGVIFTTSFFINSVSKQISEKFGEKIKLTTLN